MLHGLFLASSSRAPSTAQAQPRRSVDDQTIILGCNSNADLLPDVDHFHWPASFHNATHLDFFAKCLLTNSFSNRQKATRRYSPAPPATPKRANHDFSHPRTGSGPACPSVSQSTVHYPCRAHPYKYTHTHTISSAPAGPRLHCGRSVLPLMIQADHPCQDSQPPPKHAPGLCTPPSPQNRTTTHTITPRLQPRRPVLVRIHPRRCTVASWINTSAALVQVILVVPPVALVDTTITTCTLLRPPRTATACLSAADCPCTNHASPCQHGLLQRPLQMQMVPHPSESDTNQVTCFPQPTASVTSSILATNHPGVQQQGYPESKDQRCPTRRRWRLVWPTTRLQHTSARLRQSTNQPAAASLRSCQPPKAGQWVGSRFLSPPGPCGNKAFRLPVPCNGADDSRQLPPGSYPVLITCSHCRYHILDPAQHLAARNWHSHTHVYGRTQNACTQPARSHGRSHYLSKKCANAWSNSIRPRLRIASYSSAPSAGGSDGYSP